MIKPCGWVSTEAGNPPQPASFVCDTLNFLLRWTVFVFGKRWGLHPCSLPPTKEIYLWKQKPFPKVLYCLSRFVCLYGLNVDVNVSNMAFEGKRKGKRSQGQAAKWTSVCIRILFRLHAVCGVRQTSFWKRPSPLLRSVEVHFTQTVCLTDPLKIFVFQAALLLSISAVRNLSLRAWRWVFSWNKRFSSSQLEPVCLSVVYEL